MNRLNAVASAAAPGLEMHQELRGSATYPQAFAGRDGSQTVLHEDVATFFESELSKIDRYRLGLLDCHSAN